MVDRRFNRRKHDAAKTIQAFSTRLRDQIDLDTLSAELLAVVDQTMEPTRVSLWLRPPTPSSSGTAGSEVRPTPWAYRVRLEQGQPVGAQGLVGRLKKLRNLDWLQPPMVPPEVMPLARLPAYWAAPPLPGWVQMLVR